MKRNLTLGISLFVLAGLAAWIWPMWTAVPCRAARVEVKDIVEYIDLEAKTRIERTHKITLPVGGRVESIALNPGEHVTEGQLLAQLVPQDVENRVSELSATVDRLTASIREAEFVGVEQAEVDLSLKMVDSMREIEAVRKSQISVRTSELAYAGSRLQRVLELKKIHPKDEIDSAESHRDVKQAEYHRDYHDHRASAEGVEVAAYRAERFRQEIARKKLYALSLNHARDEATWRLKQARLDQKRSRMESPVAGIVLERYVTDERVLPAGAELLEVARLDDLEVVAEVLTQDAARIRRGSKVDIYGAALGGETVTGTVRRIEPRAYTKVSSLGVEEQRVNVIIALEEGASERLFESFSLGVGFRVRVRIHVAERTAAKVIPRFAIFRGADANWQVYAVRSGRAHLTPVRIGLMNDDVVEILDEFQPGDVVLIAPDASVHAGDHVRSLLP